MQQHMQCNWGILGPGFVARRAVIPALLRVPTARVLAVASTSQERATAVAQEFSIERVYTGYQALLEDPDIDVIYLALPNHLHHSWTLRAAHAGKHILCEKPLALNASEGAEMIAACQRAKVLLMEAVMYRFHPRMQDLKRMLSAGECGRLRFLHAAFSFPMDDPTNYRALPQFGGGALFDVGSYCVNAVRWLTGCEPASVQAFSSYGHEGIDRSTSALLRFENEHSEDASTHIFAHIQCSFAAAEYQVIEVVGTTAAVHVPLAFTAWRDDSTLLHVQRGGVFTQKEFLPADPYELMVNHFAECILRGAALLYPPTDGLATLRVLDMLRTAPEGMERKSTIDERA